MPEGVQFTVQPEKEYAPEEKRLCDILGQICGNGIKVYLGWGPGPEPAWSSTAKGGGTGSIVIDKRICSSLLSYIHNVPPDFENTVGHLLEPVSHAYAHLRGCTDHDINFYKRQSEAMQIMMANYIKRSKNGRNPMKISEIKKYTFFRKTVWTKTPELVEKIVSLAEGLITEHIKVSPNETDLIAKNLTWAQYTKLMRIFKNVEQFSEGDIKFSRAKNYQ
jgi:hypothetical protein